MEVRAASEVPLEAVHAVMEEGFRDYFVNVHMELAGLLAMVERESICLENSVLVYDREKPVGVGLLAHRNRASRVAAMAVTRQARGKGVGRRILEELVRAALDRQDEHIELEVIEQNIPALRLYQSAGFEIIRGLVGFSLNKLGGVENASLEEISLEQAAEMVLRHGLPDLPWQVSAASLASGADCRAYALDGAALVLAHPGQDTVTIRALVTSRDLRLQGRATRLLRAAAERFPGKTWQVPVLFPQEMEQFFMELGFERTALSQLQLRKML